MILWNLLRRSHGTTAQDAVDDANTVPWEHRRIGTEAPIRTASQDLLRRAAYAERLATVFSELSSDEGRVFALRGGWGFGKSSLKNLVTERLSEMKDGATWLDFNPWRWGESDAISKAFFEEIANRLGGDNSKAAKARAASFRRYGAFINGASTPLKDAAGVDKVLATVLTNASVIVLASTYGWKLPGAALAASIVSGVVIAASLLGKWLTYLGRDRSAGSLEELRDDVELRLRSLERPLVVFVDDIDRLEPEQIREIVRLVKSNGNLPNIAFVLLYQMSIVEAALAPIADGDGRAFLEKIVQVPFDLPVVSPGLAHKAFAEELAEIAEKYATEQNGFSQRRWGNVLIGCIQPMLRNMRDAKRLTSSIAVHLPLHGTENAFEVNIIDVLLLEALRVFEPGIHEALFQQRALVLQEQRFAQNHRDADREAALKLLGMAAKERQDAVKSSLKELFPGIEWAFGGYTYDEASHNQWVAAKRVCASRYFPRYFELQDALGEMSERVFIGFLEATSNAEELAKAIESFREHGQLVSLVRKLDGEVGRLPSERAANVLPALYRVAESFAGDDAPDPFRSPWISAWRATTWYLKSLPVARRGELAVEALRQTSALSVTAMIIALSDPENRNDKNAGSYEPPIYEASLKPFKDEWLRIIRERAAEGDAMLSEKDLTNLLYRWRDFSGSFKEPKAWVEQVTQTDEGFVRLAMRMMSRGTSHSAGDRVPTVERYFSRDTVENFIGVDVAKARLHSIERGRFPQAEEALEVLDRYIGNWLGERDDGPLFGQ